MFPLKDGIMESMRKPLKAGILALASLLSCAEIFAITPDSSADRYKSIPDQNAFRLKPPPPVEPQTPALAPLPKLILTGITTILGNKRVLLKALPATNAPGQQAKEESLILTEGQREGNVEVLNIDENAGSVRVNNSGTIMTLTFEKDGAKLQSPPPLPPGAPGLPGVAISNPAAPNSLPTAVPTRTPSTGAPKPRPMFPTRGIRTAEGIAPNQAAAAGSTNPLVQAGLVPPSPPVPVPAAASAPQDLTAEEQAIVQELQRQAGVVPGATSPAPVQSAQPVMPQ